MVALGAYELSGVDWRGLRTQPLSEPTNAALAFVFFVPPAILTLLAAMSFLVLRRRGWLLAAISQGVTVAVCLWLYSQYQPNYVYPIMVFGVIVILYLNVHDVRAAFQEAPRRLDGARTRDAA